MDDHGGISILENLRAKSSKFQTPSSNEAPNSKLKTDLRVVCTGICFLGLVLEIWKFSRGWALVLGVSLISAADWLLCQVMKLLECVRLE